MASSETRRTTNRLAQESSPYLLQHAHNPVDWYPWGDEAIEKARREDRPIFLSVGYSSCHWCHVMERESFEDEEVARVLNEHFVSIKVDREERPDVDAIYMTAVQVLTGSGGWPMSVFLTPDLKPFYGGTYFPPQPLYGRPSFKQLVEHLAKLYREDRQRIDTSAEQVTQYLGATIEPEHGAMPDVALLERAFESARQSFDSTWGGFGGAPKFPHSQELQVLLRYWRRSGEPLARDMALLSLRKMAEGGMYDQVGGGFHRYSVDRQWLVPHFEKMLYDNALLVPAYLEAYQVTGEEFHARIAREVLDYVIAEMMAAGGGFFSATDADSEGEEGKFFVWRPEEIESILGSDDARLFNLYYNVTVGGNFENGATVLHVTRPAAEVARALDLDEATFLERLEAARRKVYEARQEREKPFRDEKIIVAWNGLMLSAMARGYQVLGERRYLDAAETTLRRIREHCMIEGVLHRIHKDGETKIPGFLEDYACVGEACVDLYEATFDAEHLELARTLAEAIPRDFGDGEGGLYATSPRHTHLLERRKEYIDNATPSPTWVAASLFARLGRLTGEESFTRQGNALLEGLTSLVERAPRAVSSGLIVLDAVSSPTTEIAIIGDPDGESTRKATGAVHRRFLPGRALAGASDAVDEATAGKIALLAARGRVEGKTTVYVCEDFSCRKPITALDELESTLDHIAASPNEKGSESR